jgi:hypothetical protein
MDGNYVNILLYNISQKPETSRCEILTDDLKIVLVFLIPLFLVALVP